MVRAGYNPSKKLESFRTKGVHILPLSWRMECSNSTPKVSIPKIVDRLSIHVSSSGYIDNNVYFIVNNIHIDKHTTGGPTGVSGRCIYYNKIEHYIVAIY